MATWLSTNSRPGLQAVAFQGSRQGLASPPGVEPAGAACVQGQPPPPPEAPDSCLRPRQES